MDDELKEALSTLANVHTKPDPDSGFLVDVENASSIYAFSQDKGKLVEAWRVVLDRLGFLEAGGAGA